MVVRAGREGGEVELSLQNCHCGLRRSMPEVVLPDPNDPREWIVCLLFAVVIAFCVYFLLCPLPPRGKTRVVDTSIRPPRTPECNGDRSSSSTTLASTPRSGTPKTRKSTDPRGLECVRIPEGNALWLNKQPD